ncbi:amiloride-sensitive sodium channel subunit beta-like [Haliotis rubra]|uniref:amiloride-sensitive sodium channel subunit beta-like n=1 Tax=Haliotis rubra TaxID=36100 RepID=UPI001EE4F92E|nr:amiloride-sensitive sodium channel subunit beta-like [Haliotis rubra]
MDSHGFPYTDRRFYTDRAMSQMSGSYDPHYKMPKSEENSEPEERPKKTAKSVTAEFADMTSMMGVNYIHHSRRLWSKGIWLIIVLGGCAAMLFHLSYLGKVYFLYPIQTKLELGFDSLSFPAVTVCNINPIRVSKLAEAGPQMQALMQNTNTTNLIRYLNNTNSAAEPSASGSTQASGTGSTAASGTGSSPRPPSSSGKRRRKRYLDDFKVNVTNSYVNISDTINNDFNDQWQKESPRTTESEIEHEFEDLYSKIPRYKRIKLGHQLRDLVVKSSFAGRTVKNNNYLIHHSMTYGNCFTLEYPDFISRKSGPDDGVEMVLFLENYEYLRGWTNGNGAHLVVHDKSTVPLLEQNGVAISGGTETFIGLKRVNIQRLGRPYGYCDDGIQFKRDFNVTYTRQACQDYCLVRLIVNACGCYDGREGDMNRIFHLSDAHSDCKNQSEESMKVVVHCPQTEESMNVVVYFPQTEESMKVVVYCPQTEESMKAQVLVEAICAKSDEEHCKRLRRYDGYQLSQNFIKLNIYYEDLNYENITEDADYADAQFLSDIGGTLGLWIGLSVISVFEDWTVFGSSLAYAAKLRAAQIPGKRHHACAVSHPRTGHVTRDNPPRSEYGRKQNGDYLGSYGYK